MYSCWCLLRWEERAARSTGQYANLSRWVCMIIFIFIYRMLTSLKKNIHPQENLVMLEPRSTGLAQQSILIVFSTARSAVSWPQRLGSVTALGDSRHIKFVNSIMISYLLILLKLLLSKVHLIPAPIFKVLGLVHL